MFQNVRVRYHEQIPRGVGAVQQPSLRKKFEKMVIMIGIIPSITIFLNLNLMQNLNGKTRIEAFGQERLSMKIWEHSRQREQRRRPDRQQQQAQQRQQLDGLQRQLEEKLSSQGPTERMT